MERFSAAEARRLLLASAFALFSLAINPRAAFSCDLCAVYNSIETQRGRSAHSTYLGLANQFTLRESGVKPPGLENLDDQYLRSNILQIYGGYWLSERFGVQSNIPFIFRSYKRIQNNQNEHGSERGIGDITLLAKVVPYRSLGDDLVIQTEIFGGVKLPTGSSDRLKEELDEVINIVTGGPRDEGSLVGGDDLALGSGSTDYIGGIGIFTRYLDFVLSANLQYTYRTEGDYEYRYGNDFQWDVGPGYYAVLEHEHTLLVRLKASGEYKAEDEILGVEIGGSDDRTVFLGPELIYTGQGSFSARLSLELPLITESAADQVAPRFRTLLNLSYSF